MVAESLSPMGEALTEQPQVQPAHDLEVFFANMREGFALHEIITDAHGQPVDYRYLDVNPAFADMTGIPRERWLGRTVREVLPGVEPKWIEVFGRVALQGGSAEVEDYVAALDRWYQVVAFCPRPRQFAVLVIEITAYKRAEAESLRRSLELEDSRAVFASMFQQNQSPTTLSTWPDHCVLDANEAWCALLGIPREEAVGKVLTELGILDDPSQGAAIWARLEKEGRVQNVELALRNRAGERRVVLWSGLLTPIHGQLHLIASAMDITELRRVEEDRRRLEAHLTRTQKMESLGSLAGGVAHDMNNVLGAILGMAEAFLCSETPGTSRYKGIETIVKACERGRSLVRSLLDFTRHKLAEERPLDLNEIVRETVGLLQHTTLQRIVLTMALDSSLRAVKGDAAALGHALMNLCVNAVDAMPEGGSMRLQTANVDEGWVELVVTDTGWGMPPDVLEKAMDPFFTTKPQGKGTGLGLPIVYGAAKAHGGRFELQSAVGVGTTARMLLPALRGTGAEGGVGKVIERPVRLRVLMVDDDELVREALRAQLNVLGHEILEAADGPQALAWLRASPQPDLVILDLNMPVMEGEVVLARLRETHPDLPVLVATGRADQKALDLSTRFLHVSLLPKPFTLAELEQKLKAYVPRRPTSTPRTGRGKNGSR